MDNPSTYVCCSANYATSGLRHRQQICILRQPCMRARAPAWPPNQPCPCVHPTASCLSLDLLPAYVPSPVDLHHSAGRWLAGSHSRTATPLPLHLLPSGQPRLPRSRNRPLISTAMATSRRHAHTLAAYICTALTHPYRSLHLHRTLK